MTSGKAGGTRGNSRVRCCTAMTSEQWVALETRERGQVESRGDAAHAGGLVAQRRCSTWRCGSCRISGNCSRRRVQVTTPSWATGLGFEKRLTVRLARTGRRGS